MTPLFANPTIEEPPRLSYSSLTSYAECGERWRLERGFGMNKSTWFATVAGSACHEITEYIDLADAGVYEGAIPSFKEVFDRRLATEAENGIEVKASGSVTKAIGKTGGPNKKDYSWWLHWGPIFVESYITWRLTSGWHLISIDGKPAVEIEVDEPMGGEPNKGFIDRVFVTPSGQYAVVDLKFGNEPKSNLQLGNYRVALKRKHGIVADVGCYWMGPSGDVTSLVDLTVYSDSYMDALYEMAWRGIRAEVFLPTVTSLCQGCNVRSSCRAVGGRDVLTIPIRTEVRKKDVSLEPVDIAV